MSSVVSLKRPRSDDSPEPGKANAASMMFRGPRGPAPKGAVSVNVTSAQALNSKTRRDFSPMTAVPGGYKGYFCFENYWQSLKRYTLNGAPLSAKRTAQIDAWWRKQVRGRKKCQLARGYAVAYAQVGDQQLEYIESRKEVYVPEYEALCKGTASMQACIAARAKGIEQVFFDFDGPKSSDGELLCVEVTVESLREYINDDRRPFGHGWIVAALVAGITSEQYTGA